MTKEEANKIIAEFMNDANPVPSNINELSDRQKKIYQPYIYNLDALVPVWIKLKLNRVTLEQFDDRFDLFNADLDICHNYETSAKTIQEAAAIATARAIKHLDK